MNPEAQARFDEILKKDPETLNANEIAFLRARRSYLKKTQLEEYESVLNPKPEKKDQTSSDEETVKTKHANTTK